MATRSLFMPGNAYDSLMTCKGDVAGAAPAIAMMATVPTHDGRQPLSR